MERSEKSEKSEQSEQSKQSEQSEQSERSKKRKSEQSEKRKGKKRKKGRREEGKERMNQINLQIARSLMEKAGEYTIFKIEATTARNVSSISLHPNSEVMEYILVPGTQFRVKSCVSGISCTEIVLEEVKIVRERVRDKRGECRWREKKKMCILIYLI